MACWASCPLCARPRGESRVGESTWGEPSPPPPSALRMPVGVLPSPALCQGETVRLPWAWLFPETPTTAILHEGKRHPFLSRAWVWAGEHSLTELQAERCLCSVSPPTCPSVWLRAVQPHGAPLMEGHHTRRRRRQRVRLPPFRFSSWPWSASPGAGFLLLFLCEASLAADRQALQWAATLAQPGRVQPHGG